MTDNSVFAPQIGRGTLTDFAKQNLEELIGPKANYYLECKDLSWFVNLLEQTDVWFAGTHNESLFGERRRRINTVAVLIQKLGIHTFRNSYPIDLFPFRDENGNIKLNELKAHFASENFCRRAIDSKTGNIYFSLKNRSFESLFYTIQRMPNQNIITEEIVAQKPGRSVSLCELSINYIARKILGLFPAEQLFEYDMKHCRWINYTQTHAKYIEMVSRFDCL